MDMLTMIGEALVNYGMAFVLMGYFLLKDWRFNEATLETLASIREVLVELKSYHNKENGQ